MPLVNPVTIALVPDDVVAVILPGLEVTVYSVIAEPPFATGAVHETATCPFPLVPDTLVGAPGILSGVTALDAADARELPTKLVAMTVNV